MGDAIPIQSTVDPLDYVKEQAHELVDQWVEQLRPLFEQQKAPTLLEISNHFSATRGSFLAGVLQSVNESIYQHLLQQHQCNCPKCNKLLNRKRVDPKRYNTLQGNGVLKRPYYYCKECKIGFHPVDEALEMSRTFHQYDIEEKILKLAAEMPYKRAAELVSEISGISVSNHHSHDTLTEATSLADLETVISDREEIERRIDEARREGEEERKQGINSADKDHLPDKDPPEDLPVLAVALDGAHAPTRKRSKRNQKRGAGKWREVKGVRIYLPLAKGRIIHIASWHQIQDAETMKRDLQRIASLIPQEKVRIALLGDGAAWVWNTLTECFPQGKEVLDYYHCSEHVYKVAESRYSDTTEAIEWSEGIMARLSAGEVDSVIWGLQRLKADTLTREEINKLITYLKNQKGRIDYSVQGGRDSNW